MAPLGDIERTLHPDDHKLRQNGRLVVDGLNKIADKLIRGDFKKGQAIELLHEFKFVSSFCYHYEQMLGTQLKNILMFNYLTEVVKEKFPDELPENLNISYCHKNPRLLESNRVFASPENAVLVSDIIEFKNIEKRQVQESLAMVNSKPMAKPKLGSR